MKTVQVKTNKPYKVLIGDGILESGLAEIVSICEGGKVLLLTEVNVPKNVVNLVENTLKRVGFTVFVYAFQGGEQNKTPETMLGALYFLADNHFTRRDTIVAIGGGVVGDIAGLVASLYMRGMKLVQIPTTILSAIDSSVGGKTAVDLPQGKNLIGTFYQPLIVVCDVALFKTLPKKEMLCGMAEGIKYALIKGGVIWESVQNLVYDETDNTFKRAINRTLYEFDMVSFVYECIKSKADIVEEDEFESDKRRLLNFGHSIGHAIEKLSNYSLSHGECVAKGICKIMECFEGQLDNSLLVENVKNLFMRLGYDLTYPFSAQEIAFAMASDKKHNGDKISLVVVRDVGSPYIIQTSLSEIEKLL